MKNIQVIDDAVNCTYDIFSIDDEIFGILFPNDQNVEFEDDLIERLGQLKAKEYLEVLWKCRVEKSTVKGIHGTLFFGYLCDDKRAFYPTKKEGEMIANPRKL